MPRIKPRTVVLMLFFSGCAGPMGTVGSGPPPEAVVTSFDGSYRNRIREMRSFGQAQATAWCDTPGQSIITVAKGQFAYAVPHPNVPGNATPTFPATIAPDGSFSGQIIAGTISGRIEGTHIEGRIDGSACVYAFAGERI